MNWNLLEYAGPTAIAWTALAASAVAGLSLAVACAWLLVRRRTVARIAVPCALVAAYLVAWLWAGPHLDHAWLYLQQDAGRRASTYTALTFASAVLPPLGETGRDAFVHLATRDAGFAKGKPVSVEKLDGREVARDRKSVV